ncbi:MAG: hypothetical protein VE98_C0001G0212 [candidate division Kazan bacterium GW2011_GWA1_50_15]|uniref:Uncharacterized protein n=2 Tax=Bacteria division Kazan-3B-28 TaxID=1798534 RepID=A0A0G2A3N5_UNCK3|nr:MAG: hypothetical protein VE98_C0001G0212 [candidate division Kazan bacterium GW2011_GWA1_50_15]KKW25513.1 MAG: hypothetical protein VE99_C0001G0150 [candidate division Kazan bacterium GW2011_GWC1_52_13]KKW26819.1 MAG: hypothetical protein VF00_C0002G0144 [candidate division Kazan bacterium GW2011_GWB1_52_7]HAV65811.1 hypothetical protein [Patescibacteria group bacterium]HCR42778.1 hypothetical protein [Patescibacteria group bacterium]
MAKTQPKILLTDIGVTIVVFMVTVVMLGITNYRNNQAGTELPYRELEAGLNISDPNLSDTIYLFHSGDAARQIFPRFTQNNVNWDKQLLVAYVAPPQPGAAYRIDVVNSRRQGPVVTIGYRIAASPAGGAGVLSSQPVLFVTMDRDDLVSSSELTFRFQNIDTNQTTSLSVAPDEI